VDFLEIGYHGCITYIAFILFFFDYVLVYLSDTIIHLKAPSGLLNGELRRRICRGDWWVLAFKAQTLVNLMDPLIEIVDVNMIEKWQNWSH
jgi:hypothetical protein